MEDMRFLLFSFGFDREGAGRPLMPASPGKGFPSEWRVRWQRCHVAASVRAQGCRWLTATGRPVRG